MGRTARPAIGRTFLYDVAAPSAAVDAGDAGMFLRYVAWLKIVVVSLWMTIVESLSCLRSVVVEDAANDHSIPATYLRTALQRLDSNFTSVKTATAWL